MRLLHCLPLLFFLATAAEALPPDFQFDHHVISPACVIMLEGGLDGSAEAHSVNLNDCEVMHAKSPTIHTDEDGSYYIFENDRDDAEGQFSYHVLGQSEHGVYVLRTIRRIGGTGARIDYLFVRLLAEKVIPTHKLAIYEEEQVSLRKVGEIRGGDRCVGGLGEAEIEGDTLTYEVYQGKHPGDCDQIEKKQYDLAQLPF